MILCNAGVYVCVMYCCACEESVVKSPEQLKNAYTHINPYNMPNKTILCSIYIQNLHIDE